MKRSGLLLVVRLSGVLSLLAIAGCGPNYFLLHPLKATPEIYRENIFFDRGQLRVYWLARYPDSKELLPAVLIHPDRGSFSEDMEGICLDLAQRGYFAVAAHYRRLENLKDKNPLIPWKTPEDIMAALRHLQKHPRVDPGRIAVLGFSRGGIVSLQIASQDPLIKAAVAYYALADFEQWLDVDQYSFPKSLIFRWIRKKMVKEVGASNWEEARVRFRETSPIQFASQIQAPVLLVHGEKDRTFSVEQAKRLYGALPPGKGSELLILPEAGHVFNFIDREKGEFAWEKTLLFLSQHIK